MFQVYCKCVTNNPSWSEFVSCYSGLEILMNLYHPQCKFAHNNLRISQRIAPNSFDGTQKSRKANCCSCFAGGKRSKSVNQLFADKKVCNKLRNSAYVVDLNGTNAPKLFEICLVAISRLLGFVGLLFLAVPDLSERIGKQRCSGFCLLLLRICQSVAEHLSNLERFNKGFIILFLNYTRITNAQLITPNYKSGEV